MSSVTLPMDRRDPTKTRPLAVAAIKKMLRWWPELIRWDQQLDTDAQSIQPARYPAVYPTILGWCRELGHDWDREIFPLFQRDPDDVAMRVLQWVAEAERRV